MEEMTEKLKKMMKTRKNQKIVYKKSNIRSGNPFVTALTEEQRPWKKAVNLRQRYK